jgi:hypothetical protein
LPGLSGQFEDTVPILIDTQFPSQTVEKIDAFAGLIGISRQCFQFLFDFGNSVDHDTHSCTKSERLSCETGITRRGAEREQPRRGLARPDNAIYWEHLGPVTAMSNRFSIGY